MHIYVRRGGPNYQIGLAKMRALGEELGVPIQVMMQSTLVNLAFKCAFDTLYCLLLIEGSFLLMNFNYIRIQDHLFCGLSYSKTLLPLNPQGTWR